MTRDPIPAAEIFCPQVHEAMLSSAHGHKEIESRTTYTIWML